MAVGRAQRFEERKPRVVAVFDDDPENLRSISEVRPGLHLVLLCPKKQIEFRSGVRARQAA